MVNLLHSVGKLFLVLMFSVHLLVEKGHADLHTLLE
jgi:hypothetical protein